MLNKIYLRDVILYKFISNLLRNSKSVLDVGCGDDSPLQYVNGKYRSEGIDIHKLSIQKSKKKKIHDTYKIGDVLGIEKIYKPQTFDSVIAFDIIEHFKKKEGLKLLNKIETIAKKQVIILTPNGFMKQGELRGNSFQVHLSGWSVSDFEKRGYKVYGLRGLKILRDNKLAPRFKPKLFWGAIIVLSEVLFLFMPSLAFHILAVKNNNE